LKRALYKAFNLFGFTITENTNITAKHQQKEAKTIVDIKIKSP